MKSTITSILMICFCFSIQSAEKAKVFQSSDLKYEFTTSMFPYPTNDSCVVNNKAQWNDQHLSIKGIKSVDGEAELVISFNRIPNGRYGLGLYVYDNNQNSFEVTTKYEITLYFDSNRKNLSSIIEHRGRNDGKLCGGSLEFKYTQQLKSLLFNEKEWSLSIRQSDGKRTVFHNIKIESPITTFDRLYAEMIQKNSQPTEDKKKEIQ